MSSNTEEEKERFEHVIQNLSISANNAVIYEFQKIFNNKDIYFDFPFNKQLFYFSQISKVTSDDFGPPNSNKQQQKRKITIEQYIVDENKKISLSKYKIIRKDEILKHIAKQKQKTKDEQSQNQTDKSENQQNETDIELLDGIYFFHEFYECVKEKQLQKDIKHYIENLFDQFNKSVIYSFLSYFLSSCFQKLINKDILIDIDLKNFILIRDGSAIRFVYLVSFENFAEELDRELRKPQFNYEGFCSQYYHFEKVEDKDKTPSARLEKQTLNKKFQEKYKQLLVKIADSMLNEQDKKEAEEDSQFAKDCMLGSQNLEDGLKAQDIRKRFCKVIINKNYLLNAIQQKDVKNLFITLFKAEWKQDGSLTQSEILNSFLQDVLKKANGFQIYSPNQTEQDKDSIIEYHCEEFPRLQNGIIISNTNPAGSRDKSKTPDIISAGGKDHEIQSITNSKREMQIQLKIRELKFSSQSENMLRQKIEDQKNRIGELQRQQNTRDQIASCQEEIRRLESYIHNLLNQPAIRGGEKKIMIDFKEQNSSILIKFYFVSELYVYAENIDEMMFCMQVFNNCFNGISMYLDDNKRVYFETYSCLGYVDKALLRLVYMIDSIITYALTFFDFYAQNLQTSKQTRDMGKYVQLQQEVLLYMQAYNYRFDEFKKQMMEVLKQSEKN